MDTKGFYHLYFKMNFNRLEQFTRCGKVIALNGQDLDLPICPDCDKSYKISNYYEVVPRCMCCDHCKEIAASEDWYKSGALLEDVENNVKSVEVRKNAS